MNKQMTFRNLTPHSINVFHGEDQTELPVYGSSPRLEVTRENLGRLSGFHVVRSTMGDPVGLPEFEDGVILIVSALVAEHPSVADRADLAYPGEPIRDGSGKIVGCKGLCAGPGLAARMRATSVLR